MERTTALLTGAGHRAAGGSDFPVVFRGYDRLSVDAFKREMTAELEQFRKAVEEQATVEQELQAEILRLGSLAAQEPVGREPTGEHTVSVLARAQATADTIEAGSRQRADQVVGEARQRADQIVNGAKHQADQMLAHAQQQAGQIIAHAQQQAEAERSRIIGSAASEAKAKVEFLSHLAAGMHGELRATVDRLLLSMADWDSRAGSGTGPHPAVPA